MRGYEVYVGDLPSSATEQLLYNSFMAFGVINSVKIMRHIVTRQSRGFGFINFKSQTSADRAIEQMHNSKMMDSHIKVYSKSKYLKIDRNCKLLLLNLPHSYTISQLVDMCKQYGGVFSMTMALQDVQSHENEQHEKLSRRRAYILFEKVSDGLRFWQKENGRELEGKTSKSGEKVEKRNLVITFSHALRLLSIRGDKVENVSEMLKNKLEDQGEFKINTIKDINNTEFLATLEFEDPSKARELYMKFKADPSKYPEFKACEDPLQAPKQKFQRAKRDNRLFCRIYLTKRIEEDSWNQKMQERYPEFKQGTLIHMNNSEWRYEAIFIKVKALSRFLFELENGTSPLNPEVDQLKKEVEYPRSLIKSMKMNRWNQIYKRAQFQRQTMMAQMMPWIQGKNQMGYFPPGVQQMNNMMQNAQGVSNNMRMANNWQGMIPGQMPIYQNQMVNMMNPNMMNPQMITGNMMGVQMNPQDYQNTQNLTQQQFPNQMKNSQTGTKPKHGFLNAMNGNPNTLPQVQMTAKKPNLHGLEAILGDLENFKKMKKEEQNRLFMEIMKSKMEIMGDQRAKDSDFMAEVENFFLDDAVVDLDERLQILADDQRISEFLTDLASEQ